MRDKERQIKKRIAVIIALVVCLLMTTVVLAISVTEIKDNYYKTGIIQININDGEPVITNGNVSSDSGEVDISRIEPGMTLKAPFFVRNEGTFEVYYKLYFKGVSGALADVLQIEIREAAEDDNGALICSGTATELADKNIIPDDMDVLAKGQQKDLVMYLHFPEGEGNENQAKTLEFSMAADAVQTKNNPDKQFN